MTAAGTAAKALAAMALLSCAAHVPAQGRTVEVRYEPCRTVVTLGVDLSGCVWRETTPGMWACDGARPIVVEERKP